MTDPASSGAGAAADADASVDTDADFVRRDMSVGGYFFERLTVSSLCL